MNHTGQPSEILSIVYPILQSLTVLEPGPTFKATLEKTGIEILRTPTPEEVDENIEYLRQAKFTNNLSMKALASPTNNRIGVLTGGNFWSTFLGLLRTSRPTQVNLGVVIVSAAAVAYRLASGDEMTQTFLVTSGAVLLGALSQANDIRVAVRARMDQEERNSQGQRNAGQTAEFQRLSRAFRRSLGIPQGEDEDPSGVANTSEGGRRRRTKRRTTKRKHKRTHTKTLRRRG